MDFVNVYSIFRLVVIMFLFCHVSDEFNFFLNGIDELVVGVSSIEVFFYFFNFTKPVTRLFFLQANIHSIMGCEDQVLELMVLLDQGVQEAVRVEERLEEYDLKLKVGSWVLIPRCGYYYY